MPTPVRVFSCSWGQLEGSGSNLGDRVILESQLADLRSKGIEVGVASADPRYTWDVLGARPFDVSRGRIRAMLHGVSWADAVVVGGGELVQDSSSLLYSPFNLLPVLASRLAGKPCFAWAIGIGQGDELRPWTRRLVRVALGGAAGTTVRDRPSETTLLRLGVPRRRLWKTADCAFRFADGFERRGPVSALPDVLGVAPRNVSVRRGSLLPIETRRKLGLHRETDPAPRRRAWAALLDRHLDRWGGRIRLFPFHTGSLSTSDHVECERIAGLMRHSDRTEVFESGGRPLERTLEAFAACRVIIGVPLHSSILAVVTGSVPVALPYASKGKRFMDEIGMGDLCLAGGSVEEQDPETIAGVLDSAWSEDDHRARREHVVAQRRRLAEASRLNLPHFIDTCFAGG